MFLPVPPRTVVGTACAKCGRTVRRVDDGEFCGCCAQAVHHSCTQAEGDRDASHSCPKCGSSVAQLIDKRAYPVSKHCPKCGDTDYRLVEPSTLIAYDGDRVCSTCYTRYRPFTPTWAYGLFMMAGLFLFFVGGAGITWHVYAGHLQGLRNSPQSNLNLVALAACAGLVIEGFTAVMGLSIISFAIRGLSHRTIKEE